MLQEGSGWGVYPYLYPCVCDSYTLVRLVDDDRIAKWEMRNVKWFEDAE